MEKNISLLRFGVIHTHQWKVPNSIKKKLGKMSIQKVNMNDLRKKINAAHTYYLNENGSTVNYRGKAVTSAQAQYKQVLLAGYTTSNYEPIYAWRQRKQDGSYGEFLLGTQLDFDLHVINNLHSKNH